MIIRIDRVPYKKEFGRYLNALIADNRISPLALKLLLILTNCNTGVKKPFKPTIGSLAKQLNVSTDKVDRAVKELKKYGYLSRTGIREYTIWTVTQIPLKK